MLDTLMRDKYSALNKTIDDIKFQQKIKEPRMIHKVVGEIGSSRFQFKNVSTSSRQSPRAVEESSVLESSEPYRISDQTNRSLQGLTVENAFKMPSLQELQRKHDLKIHLADMNRAENKRV